MDAKQIEQLRPRLATFLSAFDESFGRPEPREHLRTYVRGQLLDLPRKSIEPIALEAHTPPRTLQQFLSRAHWDDDLMRQTLQQRVVSRQTDLDVGIIDETTYPKKGNKTPGVQRQHCGATGKKDNCAVTVHLGYAGAGGLRALLDGELFLPQAWSDDPGRCRQAAIPQEMVYRPKWQIALELLDRAAKNRCSLPWLTFDEGYGRIPQFHQQLHQRGQLYVGEVPTNFYGWCKGLNHGLAASRVDDLARHSPRFTAEPWESYLVKEGDKGPIVWQAKCVNDFYFSDAGQPKGPRWLMVARNALDHDQIKYFVSNAPAQTAPTEMLRVAFSRFAVERCFEDEKSGIGMDHFEMRNYPALRRHLAISAVSLLFLAEVHQQDREKKSGADGLPGPRRGQRHDPEPPDECSGAGAIPGPPGIQDCLRTTEKHHCQKEPSQDHPPPTPPGRHPIIPPDPLPA